PLFELFSADNLASIQRVDSTFVFRDYSNNFRARPDIFSVLLTCSLHDSDLAVMDQQRVTGPPTPAEEVLVPLSNNQTETHSRSGADCIFVSQTPEDESSGIHASAEVVDGDDTHAEDSTSDIDDASSDYVPTQMDAAEDSDDNISASRKKKATKEEVIPADIEELHENWSSWEAIYSNLRLKGEGATLKGREKENLIYSRRQLEDVLKQIPASDPLKKKYSEILGQSTSSSKSNAPKRKSTETRMGPIKKSRLTRTRQSRCSTSEITCNQQIIDFRAQGAKEGLEPKRLTSEVENMENALETFGEHSVAAKDGCWLVQGMKTPLYNYQFDGAGWALRRERSKRTPDNPKGGILADEMGCGKTITLLAVMIAKPAPKSYKVKANLLLVQSAQMAKQWLNQVKKHCSKRSLSASIYSRKSGLNASLDGNKVIIMTYSEVQRAWGRLGGASSKRKVKANDDSAEEDDEDSDDADEEQLLFTSTFHRLILDECQFIKNHTSATAKAVFQLKSRIQWLISATPAPNNLDEYFSYLKIFGLKNTETLGAFRKYWPKPKSGTDRINLEIGLEKFQLHRNHQTRIAGIPIFYDVPNSVSEERTVTMSTEERAIYDAMVAPVEREQRALAAKIRKQQMILDEQSLKALKEDVVRTSKGVEAKILHFHKLTAHPFLLETIMRNKDFSATQIMEIRELMKRFEGSARTLLDQAEGVFAKVEPSGYGRSPSMDSQSLVSSSTSHDGHEEIGMHAHIGIEKRTRKRGDDFNGYQPRGMSSFWLAESDRSHPKVPLVQSSKTRAVLDIIDCWQDDGPDDKIIIFTQWVMMGKILGRCLQDKGIEFLYYFGDMSDLERNKSLETFEANKNIKVIIMGFKCASQGLDMYYANRVILVDPWWNDDGEEQGFARVKRKVQKKATFFIRLMAEDSIDMRVAEIKKSKREMTQRLRKEDDPSRRLEIEMEYVLKTCKLKISTKSSETGPVEGPEQNASSQRGTVHPHVTNDEEEATSTAAE
ncbi:hypothetical protein N0V82_006142, partial [Gnomoniopsis sp. IMI 355080]